MELLRCTRCKEHKPATSEYFSPNNRKKNGRSSWCKACRSKYRNDICRGRFRSVMSDEELKALKATTKHCTICGKEGKLVVDHDHKTGHVRGMLCNHCNRGLGHFLDSPDNLRAAIAYIEAFLRRTTI